VHDIQISHIIMAEVLELRVKLSKNKHAYSRFHLPWLYLYPTSHPTGGVQKAWDLFSGDVRAILPSAESNPDALSTVDLGPKRPFSVGECALWARLTGPRFATQVEAVVSLIEAPANHR
jgi:hypothetical protein